MMPSDLGTLIPQGRPASFDAFSQIHLATAAERAVYRRFASDPHASWSDAETAFVSRLDMTAVRWAFERFAEAGLVEVVEEGCYRWQPAFRYVLERAEPETERRDPVCGMPVSPDVSSRADDVFGRTELFCCEQCMAAFLVWPLVFTRPPDAVARGGQVEGDHGP